MSEEKTIAVIPVEIHLDQEEVEDFLAALTGRDDDVLLAAEKAMRGRLGDESGLELAFSNERSLASMAEAKGRKVHLGGQMRRQAAEESEEYLERDREIWGDE